MPIAITLVSGFVDLAKLETRSRPASWYIEQARKLALLDIPKVLFLPADCPNLGAGIKSVVHFNPADLWLWPFYDRIKRTPIHGPNHQKDTHLYHMVQNQKTDWLARAAQMNPFKTDAFMWLDFGIFGLARGDDAAFARAIEEACKVKDVRGVRIPGCIPLNLIKPLYEVHNPLWHFCGSMFAANLAGAVEFDLAAKSVVMDALEEGNLTFEVNNWCVVHHRRAKLFDWYEADHNISMLANFPRRTANVNQVGTKTGPSITSEVRKIAPQLVQRIPGGEGVSAPVSNAVAAVAERVATGQVAREIPTYVVIPFKGMHDLTQSLLVQLENGGGYEQILLFNNGSYEDVPVRLRSFDNCQVVQAGGTTIYQMWNAGVAAINKEANGPCNIAILNNDLKVGPTFLSDIATALRQPGISVASPKMADDRKLLAGCAFMIRGEEWTTPPFDEQFMWYYGDSDFQERLVREGKKTVIVDTFCEHIGGGSQTHLPGKATVVERDRQRFMKKWPEQLRERGEELDKTDGKMFQVPFPAPETTTETVTPKQASQPLFTIILLSHNKPKFVMQAISSVYAQTFRDYECIIFDSGELYDAGLLSPSNDDRYKVIRSWETEHLRNRKHIPSWAFNECFRDGLVHGQWVVYLCDDDVLYPLALQAFADGIKRWPDAQALYAGIDRAVVDDDGTEYKCGENSVDGIQGKVVGRDSLDGKMDGMQVCHRRDALAKFGNDCWWPEGKADAWHADGLFLDKLGSIFRLYPVQHKIGCNRKVPGSINTDDAARKRMVEEAKRRPSPGGVATVAQVATRNAVQVLPGKRVVWNAIVRNESAIIERCMRSLLPFIDSYCVTDTGSTDDTPKLIDDFMRHHGKPGTVHHVPFKSFGETRNAALERLAGYSGTADYILLSDADMELVIEDPAIKTKLTEPAYSIIQKVGSLAYPNARLLRADQTKARYMRRTHEYLDTPGTTTVPLQGIWFIDHGDGANRPDKARRDVEMLKLDLADMPGDARSMYYLAQSYKEMGNLAAAIEWYDKRAAAEGSWDEEAWHAAYQSALCKLASGDTNGFAAGCWAAYERRPWRAEPLYHLARFYRERGQNEQCVAVVKVAEGIDYPKQDQLFIEEGVY